MMAFKSVMQSKEKMYLNCRIFEYQLRYIFSRRTQKVVK